MDYKEIMTKLESLENKKNRDGMARYGINTQKAYGISIYTLRPMAKEIGKNHKLAQQLWVSGIHEARLLAGFIDEPEKVTETQMEKWVNDFDSWDLCDQVCSSLFDKTQNAHQKAVEWSSRKEEFVKRAGFALMAALSVHDKKAGDREFEKMLPIIARESTDERNFVKKAVNWALRQIGKRNPRLNGKAVETAKEIAEKDSRSARWIAKDALRELTGDKVQKRLKKKRTT